MQLHIFENTDELSKTVADWMIDHINKTLQQQDRFALVLSGGNTPKRLHELLSSGDYKNKIDWKKLHIFWGDERFVHFNDERNNAKMGFDTLLNHVPVPKEQIHIMQTENNTPEDSAFAYEEILKKYFQPAAGSNQLAAEKNDKQRTFDLVLLGMGDDGHTLSLFPGKTEVIHETKKWCTSLWLESQNMYRITLTHPVVNNASTVAFLVTGNNKATALRQVLKGGYNPDLYPSQIIKPLYGELHWFVDEAAAAELQ
ncbi:MAG TPA: 6-phosphogluconolactonase [Chitinophagaceae bacterium]|jgi:6-phosphogluconolactonase